MNSRVVQTGQGRTRDIQRVLHVVSFQVESRRSEVEQQSSDTYIYIYIYIYIQIYSFEKIKRIGEKRRGKRWESLVAKLSNKPLAPLLNVNGRKVLEDGERERKRVSRRGRDRKR